MRRVLVMVAVALAAAAVCLAAARARLGVTFGSDAYSYLAWARGLVEDGETAHAAYDFTVPKPLLLAVATLGEALQAPFAVFGLWTVVSQAGAIVAAGALAARLGGPLAGLGGAVLALSLPVLWRGGLAGDSNVPYAALVVGAAALGAATPGASLLLGLAGLVRPEAWGLAVLSAALGWRTASSRERVLAVAAALVPPALWLGLDRLATGDALWSSHVIERYVDVVGLDPLGVADLPRAVGERLDDVMGLPLAGLGAAALVAGLRRMPLDPAVAFPAALIAALAVEVGLDQITTDLVGRMLTALALFAAAGAAALLARLPAGPALALVGVAACVAVNVPGVDDALDGLDAQGDRAGELETTIGPEAGRLLGRGGLAVTERQWQSALALYAGLPRERVVPYLAVGPDLPAARRFGFLVAAGRRRPAVTFGARPRAQTPHWRLYGATAPPRG